MKTPTRSLALLCTAALAGGTGGAVVAAEISGGDGQTRTVTRTVQGATNETVAAKSGVLTPSAIYAQSKDSVVYITAEISGSSAASSATGGSSSSGGTATGSGFVVSSDGYIVTNAHVIDGASSVKVKIGDGASQDAKVVGVDRSTDLALLKVTPRTTLKALTLADSSDVQVGDATYAIGNPYGLDRTLTTGVVSALHRSITSPNGYAINGVLQTDAALNPGNSGGPLLDAEGHVIGVNSQIATSGSSSDGSEGGNTGVGFAVPSDTVTRVVQQLRETGSAQHAYLGVGTADESTSAGATVASLASGGPAADAGLKTGDVITKVGGTAVKGAEALGVAVDAHAPGDEVQVTYVRDGKTRTATVKLGTRPDSATTTSSQAQDGAEGGQGQDGSQGYDQGQGGGQGYGYGQGQQGVPSLP
ncbi:S1C family serine protease [Patulibacter sp. S7RM1-6]